MSGECHCLGFNLYYTKFVEKQTNKQGMNDLCWNASTKYYFTIITLLHIISVYLKI